MPSTTPIYGFPYRLLDDSPDIPAATEDLALALETKIAAMDAILNSQIATRYKGTNAPGGTQAIGTSETILTETVTFTAVSARQYLLLHPTSSPSPPDHRRHRPTGSGTRPAHRRPPAEPSSRSTSAPRRAVRTRPCPATPCSSPPAPGSSPWASATSPTAAHRSTTPAPDAGSRSSTSPDRPHSTRRRSR